MAGNLWTPSPVARPIWSLASGYADARRRRHPLWMLEAYFDDSGRGNGPVFVLGGWLSTAERWAAFNEEWQAVLDRHPPMNVFKMQHAMTRSGVWRPRQLWLAEDREKRLDMFNRVIMDHAQIGFACIINHEAFARLMKIGLEFSDTIYYIAFAGVISTTMQYHEQVGLTDRVDFVFDEQRHEFRRALRSFLNIWEHSDYLRKYLAGTPRTAVDHEVLPLQAADYLVWEVRRKIAQEHDPCMASRRLSFTGPADGNVVVPGSLPVILDIWDDERLRELGREIINERIGVLDDPEFPAEVKDAYREMLTAQLRNFL